MAGGGITDEFVCSDIHDCEIRAGRQVVVHGRGHGKWCVVGPRGQEAGPVFIDGSEGESGCGDAGVAVGIREAQRPDGVCGEW